MVRIKEWFRRWNTLGCHKCGNKDFYEADFDYMEYHLYAYSTRCKKCDTIVNSHCAGQTQYPETKIELLKHMTGRHRQITWIGVIKLLVR